MRRKVIAAVWITGAAIPLLLGTVFVFGCCVLPFHAAMHKLMPVCELAANVHQHEGAPSAPAREKQEPVRRLATNVPERFRLSVAAVSEPALTPSASTGYRSFITLGALRCDQDVGLHVLAATFLI
ncbi:MAG: hypothetical protein QOH21_3016 [Acidobacteriota bacterium]|jgi:hypothetical protein|nr:hypothetical protein [Acidobacteriota bacterium]